MRKNKILIIGIIIGIACVVVAGVLVSKKASDNRAAKREQQQREEYIKKVESVKPMVRELKGERKALRMYEPGTYEYESTQGVITYVSELIADVFPSLVENIDNEGNVTLKSNEEIDEFLENIVK